MARNIERLERVILAFAAATAVLVALSIPACFWIVSYQDLAKTLDLKARIKATALTGFIANSPDLWMFAEDSLKGLISRQPLPLGTERVQILDHNNTLIAQAGGSLTAPAITRQYPLYDSGRIVGKVIISSPLNPLIRDTALSAALGLLLGLAVFFVTRSLPLKALRSATEALFAEKERAETTLYSISDAVITTDDIGHIQYLNPPAETLLGISQTAAHGQTLWDVAVIVDGTNKNRIEDTLFRALVECRETSCAGNSELRLLDGTTTPVEERSAPIFDQNGTITGGVMVLRDVSVSRAYTQRRSWEAAHDLLTGLINRREFEKRMQFTLNDVQHGSGQSHVICYMDLDRFKVVNDTCGHAAGDELLIQLSQMMQARIRDTDTLARLGGDEFGLMLEACDTQRGQLIANEIMAAIRDFHFVWEAKVFTVGVCVGLTTISADHISVAEVLGEADCACYWAKEQGGNRVCVYHASNMDLAARRSETTWISRINAAFAENRFVLYQQTYRALNNANEKSVHLEILLRMIGETGEIILPGRFLPTAERYNLMPEIDRWVIHEVFSHYPQMLAKHAGLTLTCAINLSGASLNSDGFLEFIRKEAQRNKLKPDSICFELTESVAVNNLRAAADFIKECKAMGFHFALDDFGTGSSSFGYLKNLPVDYLKIDGSFVKNIVYDSVDFAMTETIHRIGRILGKCTIAEYAENEEIILKLKEIGVDFAQGYGVSHPQPLFPVIAVSGDLFV